MDPIVFEESALNALRHAREHFLRHLRGITEEQTEHKPCRDCKSIRETVAHLVVVDVAAAESLRKGQAPDFGRLEAPTGSLDELLRRLMESHASVLAAMAEALKKSGSHGDVCAFGEWCHPCEATSLLASEDYYHAGQVAAIRMATDPGWDYYRSVYGD
ncbi:MAG: DinB family protein [Fimbriimonadales bacterium]|nr:DinB family protein [Fimbriimonadales bacterium]